MARPITSSPAARALRASPQLVAPMVVLAIVGPRTSHTPARTKLTAAIETTTVTTRPSACVAMRRGSPGSRTVLINCRW